MMLYWVKIWVDLQWNVLFNKRKKEYEEIVFRSVSQWMDGWNKKEGISCIFDCQKFFFCQFSSKDVSEIC